MALPTDTVDPGNVNVELQAFGVGLPAQVTPGNVVAQQFSSASPNNAGPARVGQKPDESVPFQVGVAVDVDAGDDVVENPGAPAPTSLNTVHAVAFKPGLGVGTDVSDPGMTNVEAQPPVGLGLPPLVNGGTFSPQRGAATNVTQNNVAGQVLGTGTPANVFV